MPTNSILPTLSVLMAAVLWGLLWYPVRLLEGQGLSGIWTTLVMYLPLLPLAAWMCWRERAEIWRTPASSLLLLLAAGWCNLAFVLALIEGQVVRVMLFFYLSPVWTVLLGCWLLDERIAARHWLIIAIALTGAACMLWQPGIGTLWDLSTGDWLALTAGLGFALNNVLIRKLYHTPMRVKMSLVWVGGVLIALTGIVLIREPLPQVSNAVYGWAAILGIFGLVSMTWLAQYGVTHMPVHRSSILMLLELVVGAVSAAWLAGELLTGRDWLGGGLIVLSALAFALQERRQAQPA